MRVCACVFGGGGGKVNVNFRVENQFSKITSTDDSMFKLLFYIAGSLMLRVPIYRVPLQMFQFQIPN